MPLKVILDSKEKNICNVKNYIAIAAGKGGVGKSTVTVNLARALQKKGYKVGILDADIYGPSIHAMLPIDSYPEQKEGVILPARAEGLDVISISFFNESTQSSGFRAPIANHIVNQFIHQVVWSDLDYLLVDFPPGIGDIQLTLLQQIEFAKALVLTVPTQVSMLDVKKTIELFIQMNVEIMGVVENMSYYLVGGEKHYPFGKGAGEFLAGSFGIPFLSKIAIDSEISRTCDQQSSLQDTNSDSKKNFLVLADHLIADSNASLKKELFEVEWHLNRKSFVLSFSDGKSVVAKAKRVQEKCPCMRCREKQKTVDEQVYIKELMPVGNYAIRFIFSSGCSKGIYTFESLTKL